MVKRLEEMTLQELWELFPITLVPHDDRWAQWAAGEMARLKASVFGRVGAEVHHVGSTAMKGIPPSCQSTYSIAVFGET